MARTAKKTGSCGQICDHVPLLVGHCAREAPMLFEVGRLINFQKPDASNIRL